MASNDFDLDTYSVKLEKLAKMLKPRRVIPSTSPGVGIYSAGKLPIHTSVVEEELAKVTKENEKLLGLVKDMYEDMCKVLEHTSKETPDYHFKSGYVQGIEHRIREIIDDKIEHRIREIIDGK